MKISFITDEVTQSLEEAIAFARKHRMQGVELRSVEGLTLEQADRETLKGWKKQLDAAHLCVSNLATSFFKCDLTRENVENEIKKLELLCDAADILECHTLRGFSFFASPEHACSMEKLESCFSEPLEILARRQKILLLEADPSVNITNHTGLRDLLDRLACPQLGAVYDPGNDIYDPAGEKPYPDGYLAVQKYIRHIHIKDACRNSRGEIECVCVGRGEVDYSGLMEAVVRSGYSGWLSLEPHYRKGTVLTEAQMRMPRGSEFSQGGMEAAVESLEALRAMLRKQGVQV